jgi:ribonuclease D
MHQDERLKELKEWRSAKSAALGIDPGILVNNALLEALAESNPASAADLQGLKGWHAEMFGEELYALLRR